MTREMVEQSTPAIEKPNEKLEKREPGAKANMPLLGLLAFGHMVIDINGGAMHALLPLLKSALSLSYTSSAVVILMSNITSSLIQPVFGYFADKTARRWILPLAVLLSALGIALTGLASSYGWVLLLVVVSGVG